MRLFFKKLGIPTVIATTLAIGVASTIAYATIPDSGGVIHACFQAVNGQLRVIDLSKGQSCLPSEVALDWNATGLGGPQGPAGPTGPTGPAGRDSTKTVAGAINPDGTSQLVNSQFVSSRLGTGHYRLDFPPGVFNFIPNIVVMPIGKAWISGSIEFSTGGGAFAIEYFTVGIDSNALQDTLVNFIATPFTNF